MSKLLEEKLKLEVQIASLLLYGGSYKPFMEELLDVLKEIEALK